MRKPTPADPCGSNAYAAWEAKLYVTLCGGLPGLTIKTKQVITLSLGIELSTEDFFDPHYLQRNLISLLGIPATYENNLRKKQNRQQKQRNFLKGKFMG